MSGSSSGVITQYDTIAPLNGDWSQSITIAPFDPSLGSLVGVGIAVTADVGGSVSVENLSANTGTVEVTQTGTILLYEPGGALADGGVGSVTAYATLSAFDGTDNYGGTSGTIFPNLLAFGGGTLDLDTAPIGTSAFIGTAPITLTATGSTGVTESGPGSLQVLSLANVGATVAVTYYYDIYGSVFTIAIPNFPFPSVYDGTPEIAPGSTTTAPQTFIIPDSASGWTQALSVAQFNPALGTLEAVNITIAGNASSTFELENLGPTPGTVVANEFTTLTISVAGSGVGTIVSMPSAAATVALGAYDGTQDFAGSSGTIVPGQVVTASGTLQLGDAYNLGLFAGTGTAELDISSNGTSGLTGPGDLLTHLLDDAGATIAITYTYDPSSTPEVSMSDSGGSDPTFTWTGATNTNLGTATNWDNITNSQTPATSTPLSTDTALFGANGGALTGTETIGVVQFGSSGLWSLGSGASLTVATSLSVGAGLVAVNAGASLISQGSTDLVSGTGGVAGDIQVTGTAALFSETGQLIIGSTGVGGLTVQQSGTVITGTGGAIIANTSTASGSSVNVTGADWQVGGALLVGNAGAGSLNITAGGTVSATSLDAGVISSGSIEGTGQISLSGPGSDLAISGNAIIGDAGSANLSILDGATLSAANLTIGSQGSGSGSALVSDTGSVLHLTGTLNVGTPLGVGELTIGPSATIIASKVVLNGEIVDEGGLLDPNEIDFTPGNGFVGFGTVGGLTDLIVNTGTIEAAAGSKPTQKTLTVEGTVSGVGGLLQIDAGSTMVVTGPVRSGQTIAFGGTSAALVLGDAGEFAGTVTTFHVGDELIVSGTSVVAESFVNNVLTLFASGTTVLGTVTFAPGAVSGGYLSLDGSGGVTSVACFAAGTRIGTERGEVAVEDLTAGDLVRTVLGDALAPVVWVGHRTVDCTRHPKPEAVWPVRVRAHAFGANVPVRDVYLSPDHAVYLNEVLIPVKHLVNGTSVAQVPTDTVTYYHVELPAHDVVLAENLPAESYLETGDRANFANAGAVVRQFPDFSARAWEAYGCATLVVSGEALETARQQLATDTPAHQNVA